MRLLFHTCYQNDSFTIEIDDDQLMYIEDAVYLFFHFQLFETGWNCTNTKYQFDSIYLLWNYNLMKECLNKQYLIFFQLRLLYECIPMAFIISQAGGTASNGQIPILDIQPMAIHERSPIFLGSSNDVDEILQIIEKHQKNKT